MKINPKKIILFVSFLMTALFGLISCRIVETASQPTTVNLKIEASGKEAVAVLVHKGAGVFEEINPLKPSCYQIKIPMMDGGYKQFLFIKYAVHNPYEYKIIQINKQGNLASELSLQDIEKLEKDTEGFSKVSVK